MLVFVTASQHHNYLASSAYSSPAIEYNSIAIIHYDMVMNSIYSTGIIVTESLLWERMGS